MSTYSCTNCRSKFISYSEDNSDLCPSCQTKADELEKKYRKARDIIDDDYQKKCKEINSEYGD